MISEKIESKEIKTMWASDKEHLQYLANEISELEEHLMNAKFYGWVGGFFAGIGFTVLMYLLHR